MLEYMEKSEKGIYTVNNEQFEKLRVIWEEKRKVNDVKKMLMDEIEERIVPASWIILYGEMSTDEDVRERYVGRLCALEKGIVILESGEYDGTLTGLLQRSEKPSRLPEEECSKKRILFHLRCFKQSFPVPSFSIRFNDQPAILTNYLKNSLYYDAHRDLYTNLGIPEYRWKVMKEWLDEWLPEFG